MFLFLFLVKHSRDLVTTLKVDLWSLSHKRSLNTDPKFETLTMFEMALKASRNLATTKALTVTILLNKTLYFEVE